VVKSSRARLRGKGLAESLFVLIAERLATQDIAAGSGFDASDARVERENGQSKQEGQQGQAEKRSHARKNSMTVVSGWRGSGQSSQHGAGLHSEDRQGHFQFGDGLSDFGVFADFCLQNFQQLSGGSDVFRCLFRAGFRIGFFLRWHSTSLQEF
jgi:hypothetical protein